MELPVYGLFLLLDYRAHKIRQYIYLFHYHRKMKIKEKIGLKKGKRKAMSWNVSLRLSDLGTVLTYFLVPQFPTYEIK